MYIAWLTKYIAWLTATANVMPSYPKPMRRGQRDPSTFSIYASTSWAYLKINDPLIVHIYGPHCEKCIIFYWGGGFNKHNGSILLSISLSPTINLYVRYGSNLIMSFRVKIQRMIILFGGILGNLFVASRGTKVSPLHRLNRNGDHKMF